MKSVRIGLVAALLGICAGWSGEAFAEEHYSWYESFWTQPAYQHNYHGYWRDQGYGFTNRPIQGAYFRSESYSHFDPVLRNARGYFSPQGSQRRW